VYVSGGLGPADLRELRDVVDGFGVGGYVSNADPVDFARHRRRRGEPAAKRGKLSGAKDVYRTADGVHAVGLADRSGPDGAESLMEPVIRDGEVVADDAFDLAAATERALADAETVGYGTNE